MSDWTSFNDILRDLSVAQGCKVPASLRTSHLVGCTEAPARVIIKEETEEEYYKSCGDVDFTKPPDLKLIQEALCMVTDDTETIEDKETISDLNPLTPEFIPQCNKNNKTKIFRKRNVALNSILEAQEKVLPTVESVSNQMSMFKKRVSPKKENNNEISLRRSNGGSEYIPSTLANEYYEKFLHNATVNKQKREDVWTRAEREMIEIDMRIKSESASPSGSLYNTSDEYRSDDASRRSRDFRKEKSRNCKEYIPSTLANEYYQKYLSNAKFKEQLKEDIWSKVERQIKKEGKKKKCKSDSACGSSLDTGDDGGDALAKGLEAVCLPNHRHSFVDIEDCVVCQAVANYGYSFKD